ncbi:hypothetical protein J1605_016143 [Eschrichtius robustus]|uniref:Secreted protein n=1 Tax=Eschrichtius robustus TaxID=9764 RepID=A0AB34G9Q4_ESCRO|nr:hypothetical protein J1605_016143 [Eschrichtius robustus]
MEIKKLLVRAFLVAQRLRVCLPVQGTQVRALVWEDPTCCGATGPVGHNCRASRVENALEGDKNRTRDQLGDFGSNPDKRASLVAQWLRIRLLRQGTRVRALLQEDPTCRGATKPVRHNY